MPNEDDEITRRNIRLKSANDDRDEEASDNGNESGKKEAIDDGEVSDDTDKIANGEDDDSTTTKSSKRNYFKVVNDKSKIRQEMEQTAANGQKKQEEEVNKNRRWEGRETIPKGRIYLLKLSKEKNNVVVKGLPVVITGLNYYSQLGTLDIKLLPRMATLLEHSQRVN